MTEMACMAPEGLMEQELVLLEFLSMVERLELSEGSLVLFRGDGEALSFDPVLD
jgi:heat shock protein HslJ